MDGSESRAPPGFWRITDETPYSRALRNQLSGRRWPGWVDRRSIPRPAAQTCRGRRTTRDRSCVPGDVTRQPALAPSVPLTPEEEANIYVYEQANRSVVNITTESVRHDAFLMLEQHAKGSGSGTIIDKKGHILTNFHVVEVPPTNRSPARQWQFILRRAGRT